MSGLRYIASFENVGVTAAVQDLFEIRAAAGVPIKLHRIEITAGVTTQEIGRLQLITRTGSAGTGGSAVTPRAMNPRNTVAAAATIARNVTTVGTPGNVIAGWQWNLVVPFDVVFGKPELEIVIPGGTNLALYIPAALGGTRNMSGNVHFEEI